MTLDELIDKEGLNSVCDECRWLRTHTQYHPYGSTTAAEFMAECACENDDECPRLK